MNLFNNFESLSLDGMLVITCEKSRVAWNKGFDQLDPETRARINKLLKGASPVKKGYVYNHSQKHHGKSILQWAKEYGVHNATANWHLKKWGNMDRCNKDYHKTRAVRHWGKTTKEWAEAIDQSGVTANHVREATRKGKEHFERYLSKKMNKVIKLKDAK